MGEVARIVVPNPPALTHVEDGVETQGQVYLLHAPSVATEPMVVRAPTGETLRMAAAEMYYRDAADQWDVLYGSAPASVSASGRQARYERPWPLGDDVFVAEAQRVKHYAIIHRTPRRPAAHLGDGTEFGIAWVVSGVTLPTGRHDSIEVGPFTLPRPWAQDTSGERAYGYYEVMNIEGGLQQLYLWLPADWLLSEERVYPVTVDPTVVVVSGADLVGVFHMPKSGHLVVLIRRQSNLVAYTSVDQGQTWESAGTLITKLTEIHIHLYTATVDSDDILYVTNEYQVPNPEYQRWDLVLHTFRYNPSSRTFQQVSTSNLSTSYARRSYNVRGIGVQGAQGATKTLYLCVMYYWSTESGDTTGYWVATHRWSVSPTGVLSNRNEHIYLQKSGKELRYGYSGCMSVPQSGPARIWVEDLETDEIWTGTHGGSTLDAGYLPSPRYGVGINGADVACYIYVPSWGTALMVWADGTRTQMGSEYTQAVYRAHDGLFALVGKSGNKLKLRTYDRATGTFSQEAVSLFDVGSEFIIPNAPIHMDSVPVLYRALGNNNQLMYDGLAFNNAPLAPSDLLCPNFDARYPVTFTWRFNDQDPNDRQSAYQLEIWLDGAPIYDTGWVSSPNSSHTLPGGTLQNGRSHQWRVRTKDQSGVESPWSDFAVFQTGPKPVATILYPTSDTTISTAEVTVQWSVGDQSSAIVRLYDAAGSTVLQQHEVTTPSARAKTITGLENNQQYQVSVQVTSAIGVQGDEVFSGPFSVQFTPPPKPTASATGQEGFIRISITNSAPTGDQPVVASNELWRREPGKDWVRIATGIAPDGTYDDYAVGSGVIYEYRARAVGANGTYTDSDVVSASLTITGGIWLHDPRDPAETAHWFQYHELPSSDRSVVPSGTFQFAGRRYPVVQMDAAQMERTVRYRLYLSDETDDRAALEALYARRTTLCLRNHRGRKYYVVFTEMPLEFERRGAWADVEFQVVDFDEEV